MINKDRNWKEEYEDIENELLMDKVSKAIKENPKNWQNSMDKIGFTWIDDSQDEIEEERNATPENVNQLTFRASGLELFLILSASFFQCENQKSLSDISRYSSIVL